MTKEKGSLLNTGTPPQAGRQEWVGLAMLALASVVYAIGLTILYLAVPSLSAELKPTSAQLLWIVDTYGFLIAGSLITMARLTTASAAASCWSSARRVRRRLDCFPSHDRLKWL